jgi:hypothetical protein
MGLLSWLRSTSVSEADVRSEVWKLGVRHRGSAYEGALEELKDGTLSAQRADLLRACVRKLRAT